MPRDPSSCWLILEPKTNGMIERISLIKIFSLRIGKASQLPFLMELCRHRIVSLESDFTMTLRKLCCLASIQTSNITIASAIETLGALIMVLLPATKIAVSISDHNSSIPLFCTWIPASINIYLNKRRLRRRSNIILRESTLLRPLVIWHLHSCLHICSTSILNSLNDMQRRTRLVIDSRIIFIFSLLDTPISEFNMDLDLLLFQLVSHICTN